MNGRRGEFSQSLSSSRRTILLQKTRIKRCQMNKSAFTFRKTMGPVRIWHELKLLIVFNQFIYQHLCILIMHIIITCTNL